MKRKTRWDRRARLVMAAVLLCLAFLSLAAPAEADEPTPPVPTPTPEPPGPWDWFPIKIEFPWESLQEALMRAISGFIEGALEEVHNAIAASFGRWVTMTPGIITPGGGAAELPVDMEGVWKTTVSISAVLWPVTLAIMAAVAAKDVVAARSWGIGDLKEVLFGWLITAAAAGTSIYWLDLANRITNGITYALLGMEVDWSALSFGLLVGAVGGILATGPFGVGIALVVFGIALAILFSLIFQFIARYTLLYVLVAIAPIVITISILPPARWLRSMWVKGFVLVELIGPINALLIKMVLTMVNISPDSGLVPALVQFLGAVGILSLLLTVDYSIIKFVFGAIQETTEKVVGTLASLGALVVAAVGGIGLATGAIGGGAAAAAGGAAGGAGGAAGLGAGPAGGGAAAGGAAAGELTTGAAGSQAAGAGAGELAKSGLGAQGVAGAGKSAGGLAAEGAGGLGKNVGLSGMKSQLRGAQRGAARQRLARGLNFAGRTLAFSGSRFLRPLGGMAMAAGGAMSGANRQQEGTDALRGRIRESALQAGYSPEEAEQMSAQPPTAAEARATLDSLRSEPPTAEQAQRYAALGKEAGLTPQEVQAGFSQFQTRAHAQRGIRSLGARVPASQGQLGSIRNLAAATGKTPSETAALVSGATSRAAADEVIDTLRGELPATSAQQDRIERLASKAERPALAPVLAGKGPYDRLTRAEASDLMGRLEEQIGPKGAGETPGTSAPGAGEASSVRGTREPPAGPTALTGPTGAEGAAAAPSVPSSQGAVTGAPSGLVEARAVPSGPASGWESPAAREAPGRGVSRAGAQAPAQQPTGIPLSPGVVQQLSPLDEPLQEPARNFVQSWNATGGPVREAIAQAAMGAVSNLEMAGATPAQIARGWEGGLAPVSQAMARGMRPEQMAQDAGYYHQLGSGTRVPDTTRFLAGRLAPHVEGIDAGQFEPAHPVAERVYRSRRSDHDFDVGRDLAAAIGRPQYANDLSRIYHQAQNPHQEGNWQAGQAFRQAVSEVAREAPRDLGAAVGGRLGQLIESGDLSQHIGHMWDRLVFKLSGGGEG